MNRNIVFCQKCGVPIYISKDLKNNPPRLCSICVLTEHAIDSNPLKIVNQIYVENIMADQSETSETDDHFDSQGTKLTVKYHKKKK